MRGACGEGAKGLAEFQGITDRGCRSQNSESLQPIERSKVERSAKHGEEGFDLYYIPIFFNDQRHFITVIFISSKFKIISKFSFINDSAQFI
jgi:hypothetical protein